MKALLVLFFAAALAAPAAGQGTDVTPRPKPTADRLFRPGAVAISLYAGGAAFTDFQRGTASVEGGPSFSRRLAGNTAVGVAAEVSAWITRRVGVRLHGAWLPSRFEVRYDPVGTEYLRALGAESSQGVPLHLWTLDAAALVRPSFTLGRVVPYGILGGGLASYRASREGELPPEARVAFQDRSRTSWTAVFGLGAVVPLEREGLLLSFLLTDHVTPTPLDDEGAAETFNEGGVSLSMEDPRATGRDGVSHANNLRLMVGLTLPLGGRQP
jgi:hypothetical protein